MIALTYVSRAKKRFSSTELTAMLTAFRKNNQAQNLSGLLLYNGRGTFIQTLEGDKAVVDALYEKINSDTRHSGVTLLDEKAIGQRSFPDWSMGFKQLGNEPLITLEGYSDFMQHTNPAEYLTSKPHFAYELLNHFKQTASVSNSKGVK